MKAYKAVGTPLQLYGYVVTARHPFKLLFGSISLTEPLRYDARGVVMPSTNHSVALPCEIIKSITNTSAAVVYSCGYCVTAIKVALRFFFLAI